MRTKLITWDEDEQPPLGTLAAAITELSHGALGAATPGKPGGGPHQLMLISLDPPAQIAEAARIQEQYRSERVALQRKLDQVVHALLAAPTRAEAHRRALAVLGEQPPCERCRKRPAVGGEHRPSCQAAAPAGTAPSGSETPDGDDGAGDRRPPERTGEPSPPLQEIGDAAARFAETWESLLVTFLPYDFNYHCAEADAAAALYRALGRDDLAGLLLRNHSEHDPDCAGHDLPGDTPPLS